MKETLTLLERCQREAKARLKHVVGYDFADEDWKDYYTTLNEVIEETLKQAAEELTDGVLVGSDGTRNCYFVPIERIEALTDAQKILLGELDI